MTRGMNMNTIEALDKAAPADDDMPYLADLMLEGDKIAAMTAAEVLKKRGDKALPLVEAAYKKAKEDGDTERAELIREYAGLKGVTR